MPLAFVPCSDGELWQVHEELASLHGSIRSLKEEVATLKARLCAANPNMVSFGSRCIL